MPIYNSTFFPESALAHELLDSLKGLEIGGAAHNAFGLNTLNVDRVSHEHPDFAPYATEQERLGGAVMPVDIIAPGDCIPVADGSFDFVISSHVIEHFYDPISAIKEWMRIATKYIFIICPHRDALESDRDKPLTGLEEHIWRYERARFDEFIQDEVKRHTDEHHSRWTLESFCDMCDWICRQDFGKGWEVFRTMPFDDKVGNGFCVVLKRVSPPSLKIRSRADVDQKEVLGIIEGAGTDEQVCDVIGFTGTVSKVDMKTKTPFFEAKDGAVTYRVPIYKDAPGWLSVGAKVAASYPMGKVFLESSNGE